MVLAFSPLLLVGYALLAIPADLYLDHLAVSAATAANDPVAEEKEEETTLLLQSSTKGRSAPPAKVAAHERRLRGPFFTKEFERILMAIFIVIVIAALLWIAAVVASIVFACMYKGEVTDQRPTWPKQGSAPYRGHQSGGDFQVSPAGCFEDCQYCLHGTCCPLCRTGDSMQAAGVAPYWAVIVALFVAQLSGTILASFVVSLLQAGQGTLPPASEFVFVLLPCLCVGGVGMWTRQKLRTKLSGGTQEPLKDKGQACLDFLMWCCCTCCAVVQESREVDNAEGMRVDCCCKLLPGQTAPTVGGAVIVPQVVGAVETPQA